jgi:hypothetical protein
MPNILQALDDYITKSAQNRCIWLLNEIKGVTHKFNTKQHVIVSLLDARVNYYNCHQSQNQSNAEYLALFTSNVQVLEYYKASVGESYLLANDGGGTNTIAQRTKTMRDSSIAMLFIRNSDAR